MKYLPAITLLILLLSACAPAPVQPEPLPAVDGPAGVPLPAVTATVQEKVVELATQTQAPEAFTPTAAATKDPNLPTPTATAIADFQTLEEIGVPFTTYEDKAAGLALDYPAEWKINAVPEENRGEALSYTASMRSERANPAGPKQQEGIPPDMAAVDLTVIKNGPKTLEAAIAERRAATTNSEMGQPVQIALEEEWVLRGGLQAHRFIYNLGKDPLGGYGDSDKLSSELVTIINGNMVLVSGMGDLSLFNAVASSLRQIETGQ